MGRCSADADHDSARDTTNSILCYGDSLTAGYVMRSPYTQEYHGWAAVLAKELGVPCEAIGASGWTTKKMVKLSASSGEDACGIRRLGLQSALRQKRYSTVIIMGGTNDLGTSSADEIMANLETLHATAISAGCATVALTIPQGRQLGPWTAGTPVAFANETRVRVNELLKAFVSKQLAGRCLFVAMDEEVPWARESADWEPDGLHMSELGYGRFGAALAVKLRGFV